METDQHGHRTWNGLLRDGRYGAGAMQSTFLASIQYLSICNSQQAHLPAEAICSSNKTLLHQFVWKPITNDRGDVLSSIWLSTSLSIALGADTPTMDPPRRTRGPLREPAPLPTCLLPCTPGVGSPVRRRPADCTVRKPPTRPAQPACSVIRSTRGVASSESRYISKELAPH